MKNVTNQKADKVYFMIIKQSLYKRKQKKKKPQEKYNLELVSC